MVIRLSIDYTWGDLFFLTLPYCFACPKSASGFTMSYVIVFFIFNDLRWRVIVQIFHNYQQKKKLFELLLDHEIKIEMRKTNWLISPKIKGKLYIWPIDILKVSRLTNLHSDWLIQWSPFYTAAPSTMKKWPNKIGVLSWGGQFCFSCILRSQCI